VRLGYVPNGLLRKVVRRVLEAGGASVVERGGRLHAGFAQEGYVAPRSSVELKVVAGGEPGSLPAVVFVNVGSGGFSVSEGMVTLPLELSLPVGYSESPEPVVRGLLGLFGSDPESVAVALLSEGVASPSSSRR